MVEFLFAHVPTNRWLPVRFLNAVPSWVRQEIVFVLQIISTRDGNFPLCNLLAQGCTWVEVQDVDVETVKGKR